MSDVKVDEDGVVQEPDWEPGKPQVLSDAETVDLAMRLRIGIERDRMFLHGVENDLKRRMAEKSATTLRGSKGLARLKPSSPSYDYTQLRPLLADEMVDDKSLSKAYTPPREVTQTVPEKWNGTQLKKIEREYGGDVAATIQRARIEGEPKLAFEEIEQPKETK